MSEWLALHRAVAVQPVQMRKAQKMIEEERRKEEEYLRKEEQFRRNMILRLFK